MILANWYVFYSYGWYATWTVFISFDKHSVSLWRRDCWNAIIEVISALTHVMIHFLIHQGLKWGNLWSIFHIFAPLKHPFMFFFNVHIFHGVWQGEAIAWTSFTITHVYWILGRVLLFLFFMLMTHSLNFHHTAISVQNAELQLLSLVCHYFETWVDYSDNIKGDLCHLVLKYKTVNVVA